MESLDAFIRAYGYPALFGSMVIEQFVPPSVRQRLGLLLARRRGLRARHVAISRWSTDRFQGLGLYRLFGTVRYPGAAHA